MADDFYNALNLPRAAVPQVTKSHIKHEITLTQQDPSFPYTKGLAQGQLGGRSSKEVGGKIVQEKRRGH